MRTLPFTAALGSLTLVGALYLTMRQDHYLEDVIRAAGRAPDSIASYARTRGHCPASLDELGLAIPEGPDGRFRYYVLKEGRYCALISGDYDEDLQEAWWEWPADSWHLNR